MNKKIREHRHCKKCKVVIEEPDADTSILSDVCYYQLEICKTCIIKEGIKSLQKKQPSCQGKPTKITTDKPEDMEFGKK